MTDGAAVEISALTVGIVGGTGPQGRGLAARWAAAGQKVVIGSRESSRAVATAAELGQLIGAPGSLLGMTNEHCAQESDVVVIAVPWAGHAQTVSDLAPHLAGKVVIDCVNPLGFDKSGPYVLAVAEGSATEQAATLAPEARMVGAFHNVSSVSLLDVATREVPADVLIVADDRAAADTAAALAELIPGMRGIAAGRLRNSASIEGLTANLIAINRRYKAHSTVLISGV